MSFRLAEVNDSKTESYFFDLPFFIYSNDQNWVCPLLPEIRAIFDKAKNPFLKDGTCCRWVLFDNKSGIAVGRIAAYAGNCNKSTQGSVGFFECINQQEAANILFKNALDWLTQKGMYSAWAPVNFGERDRYWGLFVDGVKQPSYQENYNPEYYRGLYEGFGWLKEFEQTTYILHSGEFNSERFGKIAQRVFANQAVTFVPFERRKKQIFADYLTVIYNAAWRQRDKEKFVSLDTERVMELINDMLPLIVDRWVWFAFYNGNPAGVFVNIRDLNPMIKPLAGKWNLLAKIQVKFKLLTNDPTSSRGILFGIVPEYQNMGIESGLIMKAFREIENCKSVKYAELAWIGDFNPRMQKLLHATGAKPGKIHYTYYYRINKK